MSHLGAAQDKETASLLLEISQLQGELRQSLMNLAREEQEARTQAEEKEEAIATAALLVLISWY